MNHVKPTNTIKVVPKQEALRTYGGPEIQLHTLTSALDGSQRSPQRPGLITPEGTTCSRLTP
jgi:hypothetical protein